MSYTVKSIIRRLSRIGEIHEVAGTLIPNPGVGFRLPRGPRPATRENPFGFTIREMEVITFIAQGKSNREIADTMVVGVRTVETYVTRILNKIGCESRVQIAIWAKDKGLS